MIKSVAQALPNYTLSTFEVPTKTSEKLDFITRKFWLNPKKRPEDTLHGNHGIIYAKIRRMGVSGLDTLKILIKP